TVGIVQTPQVFDYHPEFNWVQRSSGAVQQLFYRYVQPSRDRVDGAICVGTNAVYRRAALEHSEGFAQIAHSEDVHTGVNMIRAGFVVRYVPLALAKGLCPDTFGGYVNMVYRWCTGSMSLMLDPRFHAAPLKPAQRACFWTGFSYYLASALSAITALVPGMIMAWFFPQHVKPTNILPLLPSLIGSMVILPALFGTSTRVLELIRLNMVSSYCFFFSVFDLLRRKSAAWVPTGAATRNTVETRVRAALIWWGGAMELLMWGGVVRGIWTYGIERFWVMTLLAAVTSAAYLPLVFPNYGLRSRAARATATVQTEVPVAVSA
ncbi:MAG TPA: glycosyltransferase family 2 protein, partial [Sporichthyaceae bacterium]|nr:glycosyltransferase family 2 protein [Sporichthyaceae bacterium]